MHQVRAVILTGYLEVAKHVCLDGPRLLREMDISMQSLNNPESPLPAASVNKLLERSAAESGCDSFGLYLAECRSFASLGPLSLLFEHLPNVREVAKASITYRRYMNDVIHISMEEDADTCVLRLEVLPIAMGVQMMDLIVGSGYRILSGVSNDRWRPSSVHLVRPEPKDLAAWRRFYPCRIEFESNFNGFVAPSSSMRLPTLLPDPTMAKHAERLLNLVPLPNPDKVGDSVRRAITLLLPSGKATVQQVASHLGMSPRTLQRRLEQEGVVFGELLNEIRRGLATHYLTGSSRPIIVIGGLLGFASPGSFTRWFVGEFGVPPRTWRAEQEEGVLETV